MGENMMKTGRDRHNTLAVICHALIILLIFILPEMLMRMAWSRDDMFLPWGVYAKAGVMVCVFYLNYFVLVERNILRKHRIWHFVMLNLIVVAVSLIVMQLISRWGFPHRHRHPQPDEWRLILASASFILRDAIMLLLTISLAVALRVSAGWIENERHRQRLVTAQRESELAGLRAQLNPHFLFNILNSIYALINIDPKSASTAIHELSQLLRYVVYENPEQVEISRELDFVEKYISLMQLRMSEQEVVFEADVSADAPMIAPLLFIALVENAFKHGVQHGAAPIRISIKADAGQIECCTENPVISRRADDDSGGVGLSNLRRRIELLYGSRASLTTNDENGKFRAHLLIKNV